MRSGVDLLHVNRADLRNLAARRTGSGIVSSTRSWRRSGRLVAVQRFGQQARSSCLANAARTRKQIRVMKPLILDGIAQRARDWLLSGDFSKSLRAPFACNYLVGHKGSDE